MQSALAIPPISTPFAEGYGEHQVDPEGATEVEFFLSLADQTESVPGTGPLAEVLPFSAATIPQYWATTISGLMPVADEAVAISVSGKTTGQFAVGKLSEDQPVDSALPDPEPASRRLHAGPQASGSALDVPIAAPGMSDNQQLKRDDPVAAFGPIGAGNNVSSSAGMTGGVSEFTGTSVHGTRIAPGADGLTASNRKLAMGEKDDTSTPGYRPPAGTDMGLPSDPRPGRHGQDESRWVRGMPPAGLPGTEGSALAKAGHLIEAPGMSGQRLPEAGVPGMTAPGRVEDLSGLASPHDVPREARRAEVDRLRSAGGGAAPAAGSGGLQAEGTPSTSDRNTQATGSRPPDLEATDGNGAGPQTAVRPDHMPTLPSFAETAAGFDVEPNDPDLVPGLPSIPGALGSPHATAAGSVGPLASPDTIAQITAALSHNTDGTTEIALSPEELGHVRLRLEPDSRNPDRLVVMISFERPETLDLFRRHAGELADALRASGYSGADIGFGWQGSDDTPDRHEGFASARPGSEPEPHFSDPGTPHRMTGASLDLRL